MRPAPRDRAGAPATGPGRARGGPLGHPQPAIDAERVVPAGRRGGPVPFGPEVEPAPPAHSSDSAAASTDHTTTYPPTAAPSRAPVVPVEVARVRCANVGGATTT